MTITGMCVFSCQAEMKTTSESLQDTESDSTATSSEDFPVKAKTNTPRGEDVYQLFTVKEQQPRPQPHERQEKKKNCFRRFVSWMRKKCSRKIGVEVV